MGRAGFRIWACFYKTPPRKVAVRFSIYGKSFPVPDTDMLYAKECFNQLHADKEAIEREIGTPPPLQWGFPSITQSWEEEADWENMNHRCAQYAWFKERLEKFDEVFRRRLGDL